MIEIKFEPLSNIVKARATVAIAAALEIELQAVQPLAVNLWKGWVAHPAFEWYYTADDWGFQHKMEFFSPVCAGTYRHERGLRGDTSWIITDLRDLVSPKTLAWGKKVFGNGFLGPLPVESWMEIDLYRQLAISTSPLAGGNAYECRMELKRLLPRKMYKLINKARRGNRAPKSNYLHEGLLKIDGLNSASQEFEAIAGCKFRDMRRKPTLQPDWYRSRTKKWFFLNWGLTDPERQMVLWYFKDLETYWNTATGRVKAIDVADLVTHNLELPIGEIDAQP